MIVWRDCLLLAYMEAAVTSAKNWRRPEKFPSNARLIFTLSSETDICTGDGARAIFQPDSQNAKDTTLPRSSQQLDIRQHRQTQIMSESTFQSSKVPSFLTSDKCWTLSSVSQNINPQREVNPASVEDLTPPRMTNEKSASKPTPSHPRGTPWLLRIERVERIVPLTHTAPQPLLRGTSSLSP